MLNITIREIVEVLNIIDTTNLELDKVISNVTIDSRNVNNSSLFIALAGNAVDGHDFIHSVMASGGVCIVNSKFIVEGQLNNIIKVENQEQALGLLAKYWRHKNQAKIVAITGSNGKTTVKEMLHQICAKHFGRDFVCATVGNLNNHLGLPLTLLTIKSTDKVAIVEMGMNHAHEIEYLTSIANPDMVVVNNVMMAHAGNFTSINDISEAKGEIYSNLAPHAVALVNQAEPNASLWLSRLDVIKRDRLDVVLVDFGVTDSQCYLTRYIASNNEICFVLNHTEYSIKLAVPGMHNAKNAITAITLADQMHISIENICFGLENYHGYKRRLEIKAGINNWTIIDDTYNANLDSVKAAIDVLATYSGIKWFIFADLKEMGKFATQMHKEVGRYLDGKIDGLITIGEDSLFANNEFNGNKLHASTVDSIVEYCQSNLPDGANILIKGANSMNLDALVSKLLKVN